MDEKERDLIPGEEPEEPKETPAAAPVEEAANASAASSATQTAEPAAKKKLGKKKGILIGVIVVIVIILIAALAGGGGGKNLRRKFSSYQGTGWCTFGSDGSWMQLDTNPDDLDSDDFDATYYMLYFTPCNEAIEHVLDELGFSGAVYQRMNRTTALQGVQTAETDQYQASWTYHPDKGLEVLIEVK